MVDEPTRYRTYRRSRSVRLPKECYREPGRFYFLTPCCRERRHDLECEAVAQIVMQVWQEVTPAKGFRLWGLCIMPDHLHALVECITGQEYAFNLVKDVKTIALDRVRGVGLLYWQAKFHDHVLREWEDPMEELRYLAENPVRAGLVETWEDWRWTYIDDDVWR